MASKKLTVNENLIESCLPAVPKEFTRSIVQMTPRVFQVLLHHPDLYTYTTEPVTTVWGFVKSNGDVVRPSSFAKPSREVVCSILDAASLSGYTSIIPSKTVITD